MDLRRDSRRILVPPVLTQWLSTILQEQEGGTVPKDWVYTQYVAFCKKHGLRIKENAVFAKMFYQLFPNVTSRRIGSGRGIRSCYLGVTALKETDGPQIKKQEEEQAEGDLLFDSKTHANATNTGQPIKQERHEEGGGPRPKKRKRGRMFGLNAARKERSRRGTECHVEGGGGEGLLAEHISKADRHLSQLIRLHQCLVGGKSDYDPDVERYLKTFVEHYLGDPLMRWDLASTLEQHQRWEVLTSASNTFILLVAVFCGALVLKEFDLAQQLFPMCHTVGQSREHLVLQRSGETRLAKDTDSVQMRTKEGWGNETQTAQQETEKTNVAIFRVLLARAIFDAPFLRLESAAGLSQGLSFHAMRMLQEGQQ